MPQGLFFLILWRCFGVGVIDEGARPRDGRAHRGGTVLRPDASPVSFDDLPRNRQAEAGILAKALIGTIGVEALENTLQGMRRHAGAIVLDRDDDPLALVVKFVVRIAAEATQADPDLAAGLG